MQPPKPQKRQQRQQQINFDEIYEVIYRTFDKNNMSNDLSLESINEVDMLTRIEAHKVVKSIA